MKLQRIAIFCGSSLGQDPIFAEAAAALGRELAARQITVVTGGGHVGLMGVVADAALAAGGQALGVMPRFLRDQEIDHRGLTQLEIVDTMHQRKARMAALSDAFIALPGGFGTFEEFFEAVTWTQLHLHAKPCAVLNVAGYYNGLAAQINAAVAAGFMKASSRDIVLVRETVREALEALEAWDPGALEAKWIGGGQG